VTFSIRRLAGAQLPPRFRDLPEPPREVFVAGELPRTAAVAIVGTRTASPEALTFARSLAADLVRKGVAVLSGGAVGIDTAAHAGALDAGGATVVVAPSSLDALFPPQNAELFARVVESGGALLSAYERDVPAAPCRFFQRNSLLAALSDALVVVETRYRGGARNAASAARRLGRPVLAVPAAPWTKTGGGCILELKAGARLAASAADVLDVLGLQSRVPDVEPGATPPPARGSASGTRRAQPPLPLGPMVDAVGPWADSLGGDGNALVELLRVGPLWLDEICVALGLSAPRVQELVLTLTLENVVVSEPSGRVALASTRIY
jgi:DNA processing protein